MWELDHKETWTSKNWCFLIVVLEKTVEGFLDCKESKPVNSEGKNQCWIFLERTNAQAETPIFLPPGVKSQLFGKDTDAGKDGKQEDKGV